MSRRRVVLALAAVLAVLGVVVPASAALADGYVPITGTGSTWSQNALDQWRRNVASNYGMTVNYSGVGSSQGRRDFISGSVDFAISEIPFQTSPEDGSPPERPANGYAYMPIVAGGTSFMYNLKIGGKQVTNLRLSGDTITKIFTGAITSWDDPAIKADNPSLAMPARPIVPVIRSDGSGTTAQFTLWMSKQFSSLWQTFCAKVGRASTCGFTSQYPIFGGAKAQRGSDGVSGYVAQNYGEGAITYVEYSYAKKSGFPVVKVLNAAGYYIEPTAQAVAVGLLAAKINTDPGSPDYLTQILDGVYNNADPRTYPLSSYSYLIVPTQVAGIFTEVKGRTLGTFASYMICEGQQQADSLGYSPLPMNLVQAAADQIKRIPGADPAGMDLATCNNPTFKPGDNPASNQLAASAPQPAACDKKGGTSQCTTGTGGALAPTAVTAGSGGGGGADAAADPGTGGAGTGGAGDGGAAADGPVDAVAYDDLGQPIDSSGGGSGSAVSAAFVMPASASPTWVMVGAAVLLLAAIALPPLVSRRLRNAPTDV